MPTKMKQHHQLNCSFPDGKNPSFDKRDAKEVLDIITDYTTILIEKLAKETGFNEEISKLVNGEDGELNRLSSLDWGKGIEFNIRFNIQKGLIDGRSHARIDLIYKPEED